MADDDMFMGLLKDLGSKIGNELLSQIFGDPATLTLADIKLAISEEINKAFFQQGVDDELLNAAAILHDAQSFLAIDYQNAKNSGTSKAELWEKLDESTTTPHLSKLNTEANELESWIDRSAGQDGGDKAAASASTIYMGLVLHICLFHHERSLVAPDDQVVAELNDMRDKARLAIATMMPHVLTLITNRLGCLSYQENDRLASSNPLLMCVGDSMTDHWFDGGGRNTLYGWRTTAGGGDSTDYRTALRNVMHCTSRLLWNGAQPEADALWNALQSDWLREAPFMEGDDFRDDFRGLTYSAVLNFGKWAANARNLLMQLDIVATGVGGVEQEQWNYCAICGMLHFGGAAGVCPGSGPFGNSHFNASSFNYVLHCDSPSPPSGTQADWRWCKNCGTLHFTGGGASVCSAGGAHSSDGSGNYVLLTAPGSTGIATVQDNWRYCRNCGSLHYGSGPGVCPGSPFGPPVLGPHDASESDDYQLSSIGNGLWVMPF